MKKKFITILLVSLSTLAFNQNQIDSYIKEAQGFITQKNYKQAQMSLQDAINELNSLVAKQLIESLPKEINGLKAVEGEEIINGNAIGMMGSGMQITKNYHNESKKEIEAELMIIANSPMLSGLNMFLTNPGMLGQGQKSARVGARRAIIKTESEDYTDEKGASKQIQVCEIQIPLSQTLITFKTRGFATEQEALAFASKFDLDKIKTLLGEQ